MRTDSLNVFKVLVASVLILTACTAFAAVPTAGVVTGPLPMPPSVVTGPLPMPPSAVAVVTGPLPMPPRVVTGPLPMPPRVVAVVTGPLPMPPQRCDWTTADAAQCSRSRNWAAANASQRRDRAAANAPQHRLSLIPINFIKDAAQLGSVFCVWWVPAQSTSCLSASIRC